MDDHAEQESQPLAKSGGNGDSKLSNADFSTVLRKRAFLRVFAKTGNVTEAAQCARVTPKTIYQWRKEDSEFLEAAREAETAYADYVQSSIRRRGIDGVKEVVVSSGKLVMVGKGKRKRPLMRRKFSDPLALAEARRVNPTGYGTQDTGGRGGNLNIGPVQINNTQINQLHPERVADLDELELMLVDTFKRAGLTADLLEGDSDGAATSEGGGNGNGGG
jgi:transposase-like protein